MFGWFKKTPESSPSAKKVAHQPPGEVFSWPKGWRLSAIDEARIAVPAAILGENEVIGSVIHCAEDVQLNLPTEPGSSADMRIVIWLKPGQSVWLAKSCQGVVLAIHEGDSTARRFTLAEVAD